MKRLMIFFLLMAVAALSAAGQVSSKTAELGWLEEYVQQLATSAGEGWVVTGCIDTDATNWVTDVAGRPIAVPEGFFKAVLLKLPSDGHKGPFFEAKAWVVENRKSAQSGGAAGNPVTAPVSETIARRTWYESYEGMQFYHSHNDYSRGWDLKI